MSLRSFLRHLLFSFLLICVFILMVGWLNTKLLLIGHRSFFLLWLSALALASLIATLTTQNHGLQKFFLAIIGIMNNQSGYYNFRSHRTGTNPIIASLFLKWGSCAKCVSWWLGAMISIGFHLFYWNDWVPIPFFTLFGASFGAAQGVGFYLLFRKFEINTKNHSL